MYHDVSRETYNAMVYAGLPPGAGGSEAVRQANVQAALTVYVPLDWLWFVRSEDYALTPEALASELDMSVLYNTIERMVYARKTSDSSVPTTATLWTTQPAITQSALYTQLVHTTQVEKALHLATYESQQGNVYKILVRLPLGVKTIRRPLQLTLTRTLSSRSTSPLRRPLVSTPSSWTTSVWTRSS